MSGVEGGVWLFVARRVTSVALRVPAGAVGQRDPHLQVCQTAVEATWKRRNIQYLRLSVVHFRRQGSVGSRYFICLGPVNLARHTINYRGTADILTYCVSGFSAHGKPKEVSAVG